MRRAWRAVLVAVLALTAGLAVQAPPSSASAAHRAFVHALYEDFLLTVPPPAVVTQLETALDNGTKTRANVISDLLGSTDFRREYIYSVFLLYTGLPPTQADFDAALWAMGTGAYLDVELVAFTSIGYEWDGGETDAQFVSKLYPHLVARPVDAPSLAYWVASLQTHSRWWVAESIARSAEAAADRVQGDVASPCASTTLATWEDVRSGSYCLLLKRPADSGGATYWTNVLVGTSGQLPTLWRSLAASPEYLTNAVARFPNA